MENLLFLNLSDNLFLKQKKHQRADCLYYVLYIDAARATRFESKFSQVPENLWLSLPSQLATYARIARLRSKPNCGKVMSIPIQLQSTQQTTLDGRPGIYIAEYGVFLLFYAFREVNLLYTVKDSVCLLCYQIQSSASFLDLIPNCRYCFGVLF